MKTLSIYVKLIVYFLAVALTPMLVVGLLAYYKINNVIRADNQRMLRAIATDTAYKVERDIRQHILEVTAWARLAVMPTAIRERNGGEVTVLFDRLIATLPAYDLLLLLDSENRVVAVNTVSSQGKPLNVAGLRGKPWTGDERIGDTSSRPHLSGFWRSALLRELYGARGDCFTIVAPVTAGADRTVGKVVAYVSWAHLQDILDVVQASLAAEFSGAVFMIEDDTHRLIGHRNRRLYGEKYLTDVDLVRLAQGNGLGIFEYKGPVLKTIGYAKVRMPEGATTLPWLVCVEVANDIIYAEATLMRGSFILLTLIAALLIVIFVYFISRRFTKPIAQLVDGAQAIADGKLRVAVDIKNVDEFGLLANAFNQMSEAIRERDEELKSTNLQLKEANRLKSQFLANMSHELRTPMNSVIGFTTLTLQRAGHFLPDQYRENLVKVRKNAFHLLGLLNSILDLSKIEAGAFDVTSEEFSLRALFDQCLTTISLLVEEKRLALKNVFPEQDVLLVQDRQKVQQILINLLSNATKFTQQGFICAGFEQTTESGLGELFAGNADLWVRIWIEDSGIGIPETDLPRIFSEFVEVSGAAARRQTGAGLGLAISKKLANLLGGDILVKSEMGEGSTFTVVIPVRHPKAAPKPAASDLEGGPAASDGARDEEDQDRKDGGEK